MMWFLAVATGWAILAVLLGLLIGNGIRIERGRESRRPSPVDTPCPVVEAGTVDDVVAAAAR